MTPNIPSLVGSFICRARNIGKKKSFSIKIFRFPFVLRNVARRSDNTTSPGRFVWRKAVLTKSEFSQTLRAKQIEFYQRPLNQQKSQKKDSSGLAITITITVLFGVVCCQNRHRETN